MTAQKAEGIHEPPEAHNYLVYVIGIAMCMSGMAYGYDTGFFVSIQPALRWAMLRTSAHYHSWTYDLGRDPSPAIFHS